MTDNEDGRDERRGEARANRRPHWAGILYFIAQILFTCYKPNFVMMKYVPKQIFRNLENCNAPFVFLQSYHARSHVIFSLLRFCLA